LYGLFKSFEGLPGVNPCNNLAVSRWDPFIWVALINIQRGFTMLSHETILKQIEENKKPIKRYGVKEIGLFGSYVRDEQKTKSDIDILVEFEQGKKLLIII
jgi:hypothetical protein